MSGYYYLDVAFLTNFLMDYLLLWMVKKLWNLRTGKGRLVLAAIFGAFCSCVLVPVRFWLPEKLEVILTIFALLCPAAFMCGIAFQENTAALSLGIFSKKKLFSKKELFSKKKFFRNYLSLLFLTFMTGGIIYSFGIVFDGGWDAAEKTLVFTSVKLTFLTAIAAAVFLLARFLKKEEKKQMIYPVKLVLFGQEISCLGLLDTGNCLYDPFFGKPVVVLTDEVIGGALFQGLKEKPEKTRFVPFHSIGKKQGMLTGTELEELAVRTEEGEFCQKKVIAVYADFASQKEYQVILHPDLLS